MKIIDEGLVPHQTADKRHIPQHQPMTASPLPTGKQERKNLPMASGLLDYFPAALAEVARVSKIGNDQHNPGQPLHHARGKSMDHADCIVRHLLERGTMDDAGTPAAARHSAKLAWRALALLQEELEAEGAPLARAAKVEPSLVPVTVQEWVRHAVPGCSGHFPPGIKIVDVVL